MGTPLTWIRNRCSKLFYRFGIHCATHQIRLILISGLVITSLFYPALGIYASSNSKFFPTSRHILAHIDLLSLSFFHDDLESVWAGHDALRTVQDTVSRAKCGIEKTLRVERVLLTTNGFDSENGAITHELLSSTLKLETILGTYAGIHNLNCLNAPTGGCLVFSPMELWSHDEQILRDDSDLLRTINSAANITTSGLPLRKTMVFAGRESAEMHDGSIDFAAYLALTYFFHEDDCNGSSGHNSWLTALDNIIASHGVVSIKAEEPVFLTLTFDPEMKSDKHVSLITLTLYLSYIIFFVYFSGCMRRMDTVHSRIGLCFTGLVEILVSTITSLSVCALYGLRLTLIPWGIFPIVIVFVGAENMFRLIDDVVKTPVSLPVKERIGLGLGRAGTSNTLKVVSYNSILGVIAFFAQGAIRQFCAFAIVVLVAHWFLIHTFFVAVLSIDIQRLELDDLIRQNPNLAPTKRAESISLLSKKTSGTKGSILSKLQEMIRSVTKGRLTKNVSLLLMLVIAATLYYSTLPSTTVHHRDSLHATALRPPRFRTASDQNKLASHVDARKIWRILSPDDDPRVHMRVEPPIIITLDRHLGGMKHTERPMQLRWSTRSLRPILWIFKVMVLPIGATLSCLYLLLLYLLMGTDRLENSRPTPNAEETGSTPIEGQPTLTTYPRAFPTDVAFLSSNSDGSVLLSVSIDGDIFVWSASSQKLIKIDNTAFLQQDLPGSCAQSSVSTIAVSERGNHFAAGTESGLIILWSLKDSHVNLIARFLSDACSTPVVELDIGVGDSENKPGEITSETMIAPIVTANYEGGFILQWHRGSSVPVHASTHVNVIKAKLIRIEDVPSPLVCFFLEDGDLEILDASEVLIPYGTTIVSSGSSNDFPTDVDLMRVFLDGKSRLLLAAARTSGLVTIWCVTEGICISTIDDDSGIIHKLRMFPIACKACPQCGEIPLCSFGLAHSIGNLVFVDRGTLSLRCSCPVNRVVFKAGVTKENQLGRHSRSSSFVSLNAENGQRPRSRKSSIANEAASLTAPFPISGHGMHSRRASEKDNRRTNGTVDGSSAPSSYEDLGATDPIDPHKLSASDALCFPSRTPDNSEESTWRNLKMQRIAESSCERGGWDIVAGRIAGLCRRPRKHQTNVERAPMKQISGSLGDQALSLPALDRWDLWIVDPAKISDVIRTSVLSELKQTVAERAVNCSQFPKLSFTRLAPVIIKKTFGLLGFGNTVGLIDMRTSLRS